MENTVDITNDLEQIDHITKLFFDVFTNKDGRIPNVMALKKMFIAKGIIISNTEGKPIFYDVNGFIKPRIDMLTNGTLINFCEKEVSHKTEVYRNVAHRFCHYEKSGELHGQYFESKGMKTIQFIKVNEKWMISSVAWADKK